MDFEVIIKGKNEQLPGIGSKKVSQLNFVVKSLEQVKATWGKILEGVRTVEYTIPPFAYVPTYTRGEREDCDDVRTLKFELEDGMVLAFWQPGEKKNPWKDQLDRYGESLMNVEFVVPDMDKACDVINEITGERKPYHYGVYPTITYAFFDTKAKLGVDLNICSEQGLTKDTDDGIEN